MRSAGLERMAAAWLPSPPDAIGPRRTRSIAPLASRPRPSAFTETSSDIIVDRPDPLASWRLIRHARNSWKLPVRRREVRDHRTALAPAKLPLLALPQTAGRGIS